MKVAVVGSGVSGLGATWLLNEYSEHEVHLYEADNRPGGHAHTVRYVPPGKTNSQGVDVDTGFIVCNPDTYPNFLRFLRLFPPSSPSLPSRIISWLSLGLIQPVHQEGGIRILPTEMTFSVSRDGGAFEWAGKNLATIFCQTRRLFDPDMWRMIYDILRFNVCGRRVLLTPPQPDEIEISIGDYLTAEGYSDSFRDNYLIPMTAAIWSTPPDDCFLDFPARTLIQFMFNHNLLQITGKPSWLTIQGGSHKYVNQILSKLPEENLHLSTAVTSVKTLNPQPGKKPRVLLTTEHGDIFAYDHVILACHSDTALDILRAGNIAEEEERILNQFSWNRNEVILHSDTRMMPRSRKAWSCWNYLSFTVMVPDTQPTGQGDMSDTTTEAGLYSEQEDTASKRGRSRPLMKMQVNEVSLTYGMNDLQHIPESSYGPVLVTLNPPFEANEYKVFGRWKYDHPVLDSKAVLAQSEMHKIQNTRSISYAGAYLKYGFHEDGFTSGLLAACSVDETQEGAGQARRQTVHPPFDIRHADHHVRLAERGTLNVGYEFMAGIFDWLEGSGVRSIFGDVAGILLGLLGWFLGVKGL
ncbi:hypothetical protein D9619_007378 [Psilocybe cf. subviscida]|uniref:Amine oxidase domain-containing protein n=1 Tax=Psilocybe cf. subviscida TaxID=2480587 RepID=A0A8H5B1N6_9AGAR|nr:hypothetical protein D9619_007378 [Psilocybe cf. subviscida]